ncbi:MAG: Ig-like domain-containing protein, partial [Acidobacteriota bacterium]
MTLEFAGEQVVRVVENDALDEGAAPSVEVISVSAGLTADVVNTDEIQVGALDSVTGGGEGTVVYRVFDGLGGSDTAEIKVTVLPRPNTDPVAKDDTATTVAGAWVQVDVDANDTDAEGDALTVSIFEGPENGEVEVRDNGDIRYTPNAGFVGTDVMTYKVDDGFGGTATAALTVNVEATPTPDPMPAFDVALHATEGDQAQLAVLEDGTVLTAEMLGNQPITIVATTEEPFDGSLYVAVEGLGGRIENLAPYALFSDNGRGDLFGGAQLSPGEYTFTYEAFSGRGGSGESLGRESMTFTVTDPVSEPEPEPTTYFEAAIWTTAYSQDRMIAEVADGDVLDADLLEGAGPITLAFTATEDAPDFGSVGLSYNGYSRVENVEPYALFSDNARGNFFGDAGF